MRNAGPPISAALALCLCLTGGPAAAGATATTPQGARLQVAFVPEGAGRRTTIELSLRLAAATGPPPPPLRALALRMPAGMGVATTTLGEANCSPASLLAAGLRGCSPNAVIGVGAATAVVPSGSSTVLERASLHALMGPPVENRVEVLFYVQALSPVFAQLVLPGVLAEDAPPYGERLETSVPLVEAWPEGPDLALQTFSSTLGPLHLTYHRRIGGRTVSFHPTGIRIPSVCPAHGYPFAALLNFADGTHTTASYRVPCPAR